jgi:hypothetical protein
MELFFEVHEHKHLVLQTLELALEPKLGERFAK